MNISWMSCPLVNLIHVIQSYTPYRTQQRPIVTSFNMAEYIQVGVEMLWTMCDS